METYNFASQKNQEKKQVCENFHFCEKKHKSCFCIQLSKKINQSKRLSEITQRDIKELTCKA